MEILGIDAIISPQDQLNILSQLEVNRLQDKSQGGLYDLFRRCSLAVLNCGNETDDAKAVLERYKDFNIRIVQDGGGIKIEVENAPPQAFVDGEMIKGIREHLFAVLRDLIYVVYKIAHNRDFDLNHSDGITNAIFHILRNARAFNLRSAPNLVICWGGHSIGREEYDYSKEVGYQLGLRNLNICTGCGPGAMKGPMKGATISHAKQRFYHRHYVGITEPGIIAAEPPNPIVNDLVILPDIEKRLEAFVRLGHAFIVFPGGAGTAEEILYLLGIMMHPKNKNLPMPLIFTGPKSAADYFHKINDFICKTLGPEAQKYYQIIIDDPEHVARYAKESIEEVHQYRLATNDALYYNWQLFIDHEFQMPFAPTHENVAGLNLHRDQEKHLLAANLRRAFSSIVAGNVKEDGISAIEAHGPFSIKGSKDIMEPLDELLTSFVEQGRMSLSKKQYNRCYEIES